MGELSYSDLKKDLDNICRACLNDRYDMELTSDDCHYLVYPSVCPYCGERKHIVSSISRKQAFRIQFKLMMK